MVLFLSYGGLFYYIEVKFFGQYFGFFYIYVLLNLDLILLFINEENVFLNSKICSEVINGFCILILLLCLIFLLNWFRELVGFVVMCCFYSDFVYMNYVVYFFFLDIECMICFLLGNIF